MSAAPVAQEPRHLELFVCSGEGRLHRRAEVFLADLPEHGRASQRGQRLRLNPRD